MYSEKYENKYAIIVGINKYNNINNLYYAVNDAKEIRETLIKKYNYDEKNIVLLLDEEATKTKIMNEIYKLVKITNDNDNVIFYYAGHGYTISSKRGEVGFLLPVDTDIDNINSFIRWDDLTKASQLAKAKHILFIMDACYSGLAITRTSMAGSKRFVKDMLKRYSRQVLTAGKGNETVSDGNGPLPNHSIFTGHLLEGLSGKAKMENGIISANSLMSYVYEKVGNDTFSQQTPHFGYFDGDGDFILNYDFVNFEEEITNQKDDDILITIPSVFINKELKKTHVINELKELLSEDKNHIKIEEMVNNELRNIVNCLTIDNFPTGKLSEAESIERIHKYEELTETLVVIAILLCKYGKEKYKLLMKKIIKKLYPSQFFSGYNSVIGLQYYPLILVIYNSIIASLESNNFEMIKEILDCRIKSQYYDDKGNLLVNSFRKINDSMGIFKNFNTERNYKYPFSEYLFKKIQPLLDDLLFLGDEYESYYTKTEIIISIKYAAINYKNDRNYVWGPHGRYLYLIKGNKENEYKEMIEEKLFEKINIFASLDTKIDDFLKLYEEFLRQNGW